MILKFTTPCAWDERTICASFGFAGAMEPTESNTKSFSKSLDETLLTGTYDEILAAIPQGMYQAGLVFLGNCGGEDAFIKKLAEKAACPLTGGAAAIDPQTGESGLVAGRGQAAVMLISDGRYDIAVESRNIHDIAGDCTVDMESPRVFRTINGEDPVRWYNAQRKKYGLDDTDFEHFTLSDEFGVNAHLSVVDGKLHSGRDLEPHMCLRYLDPSLADERIREFYDDETALICGCAGLKGTLTKPIESRGTGLFLFGEVCTINGVSRFGNLMLSKLCVKERGDVRHGNQA